MGVYNETYLNWIARRAAEKDARYEGRERRFYASSVGTCHIKQIVSRAGVKGKDTTAEKLRMFDDRSTLHDKRLRAYWDEGLALSVDLRVSDEWRGLYLTPYMRDGYGGRPDCVGWLGNPDEILIARANWQTMLQLYEKGDRDWMLCRDFLRGLIDTTDVKTAHPNLIRFSHTLPKHNDKLQASWPALVLNDVFDLDVERVRVQYSPSGGESDDIECEFSLSDFDARSEIEDECDALDEEWEAFHHKDGLFESDKRVWDRPLPPVLPLVESEKKEKYQVTVGHDDETGDPVKATKTRQVVFLEQGWECGYCQYAGTGCKPKKPRNKSGDRVGIRRDDQTIYVDEWCKKAGFEPHDGAVVVDTAKAIQ